MKHFDADGNELDRSLPSLKELWAANHYILFGLFLSLSPAALFSLAFDWPAAHVRATFNMISAVLFILGVIASITIWWVMWSEATFFMYARRDHRTWEARRKTE